MDRLGKTLDTYPSPAYVVSALDFTILVANRHAIHLAPPGMVRASHDLVGLNLAEIASANHIDLWDHPAAKAQQRGVHSLYYVHRNMTVVASRLSDVPTRPPAVLVTGRYGDEEPLAVAEHMRITGTFRIANAIDDMERDIALAHRLLAQTHDRLREMSEIWHERIEAYADIAPAPLAELELLDAANERSERTSLEAVDLSVAPSTLMPPQTHTRERDQLLSGTSG
jgi:hypothetical protein